MARPLLPLLLQPVVTERVEGGEGEGQFGRRETERGRGGEEREGTEGKDAISQASEQASLSVCS